MVVHPTDKCSTTIFYISDKMHFNSPLPTYSRKHVCCDVLIPVSAHTGGIESFGGSLIISVKGTAKFAGNNAKAGGGAIMMMAPLEVKLANVTFASNTAKSGGAISLESTNYGQRVYDNCIFKDNVATDGGAVYFFGGAGDDYVTNSVFCNNYASKSPEENWLKVR